MKGLILTDSLGLPRAKGSCRVEVHDTWPELLRAARPTDEFQVFRCGGATVGEILEQAGYFEGWVPDLVVIQSGIVDCAPRALSRFEQELFGLVPGGSRALTYLLRPALLRLMRRYRRLAKTSPRRFSRSIDQVVALFPGAAVVWMEIVWSEKPEYAHRVPGIQSRIQRYNELIRARPDVTMLELQSALLAASGICLEDHHHLNRAGHRVVFEALERHRSGLSTAT